MKKNKKRRKRNAGGNADRCYNITHLDVKGVIIRFMSSERLSNDLFQPDPQYVEGQTLTLTIRRGIDHRTTISP